MNPENALSSKGAINLHSLDALRGVLALYVCTGHARFLLWCGMSTWTIQTHEWTANALAYGGALFKFGEEAVMVFFTLSGFFIHLRWAQERQTVNRPDRFRWTTYVGRRAHRILPPYLLALLATVLLDAIGHYFYAPLYEAQTGTMLDETFRNTGYGPANLFWALVLLPSALWQHFGTNTPLWSLGCEIVYYVLYPVWLLLRRRSSAAAYGLGLVVGLWAVFGMSGGPVRTCSVNWPLWLAGAALAEWFTRRGTSAWMIWVGGVVGVAGFALSLPWPDAWPHFLGRLLMGAGVVAMVAALPAALAEQRLHSILEWFGVRSYSIYICHFPCLTLLAALWFHHMGAGRPQHGWAALAGLLLALIFCVGCFELVERRFLHRAKPAPAR